MSAHSVLVLGGAHAGKTHFAGQLLGRLRHDRKGKLRLVPGGVDDLTKLEEVLSCLGEGRAAGHTPAETWTGIRLSLESAAGVNAVLEWPEYAGERLFSIIDQRALREEWRTSVKSAKAWVLIIRLKTVRVFEDILERPTGTAAKAAQKPDNATQAKGWDDQARYVELLQMLLFAAGHSTFELIKTPRLAIVLSCWDELGATEAPDAELAKRMPLLDAFIRTTWSEEARSVWALSALGQALSQETPDLAFAAKGPEHFGYVIPAGSSKQDHDLTAPIAWLLAI